MRLLVHVALRSLMQQRLISALLVAAVTAGVAFQIPNTANNAGYAAELVRIGLSRGYGHLVVTAPDGGLLDGAGAMTQQLAALPFVRGVAARVRHGGVIFHQQAKWPVRIIGIHPGQEATSTHFCSQVVRGACLSTDPRLTPKLDDAKPAHPDVVFGGTLARKLASTPGDLVKLVIPYDDLGNLEFSSYRYRLAGVLRAGGGLPGDYDVYMDIAWMAQILGLSDQASHLFVFIDDRDQATRVLPAVQQAVPGAKVQTWHRFHVFIANGIAASRTLGTMSAAMVLFAVLIPVIALLTIDVLHGRQQIAILAAMGFDQRAIFTVYLLKSVLVGLAGVGLGIAGGLALCHWFELHPLFSSDGFVVRPVVDSAAILLPSAMVFATTVLAGLLPAMHAARANPSLLLREG